MAEWFSTKTDKPGISYRLVYIPFTNTIEIAKCKGGLWRTRGRKTLFGWQVSHWMPLPEEPKEDEA